MLLDEPVLLFAIINRQIFLPARVYPIVSAGLVHTFFRPHPASCFLHALCLALDYSLLTWSVFKVAVGGVGAIFMCV